MLIKLIVRVRHALMTYPQQSYDVSVHVYTYTKTVYSQKRFDTRETLQPARICDFSAEIQLLTRALLRLERTMNLLCD